ncbi:hypothetical protein T4B_14806 [Trichinella pseudospiralis]|uniref:Uncharacterized protein n=1 Tax=Trichinella pseudospiralis TaxID=6337 RepID=A0A0V1DXG0_TRIPS|nr:hypothetical protein T4A_13801 [Trichinella pseudospiralis]KRZ22092.1 hypothetical protein T4B_14806 [Trichinella pseudospiralis]KRZ34902.1 hypothetical protein T4C_3492 [Trichinella pseudospiralis]
MHTYTICCWQFCKWQSGRVEKCSCGMGEKLSSNCLLLTAETNFTGRFVIYIFPLTEIAQQMLHGNGPIKSPHLWEWFFLGRMMDFSLAAVGSLARNNNYCSLVSLAGWLTD